MGGDGRRERAPAVASLLRTTSSDQQALLRSLRPFKVVELVLQGCRVLQCTPKFPRQETRSSPTSTTRSSSASRRSRPPLSNHLSGCRPQENESQSANSSELGGYTGSRWSQMLITVCTVYRLSRFLFDRNLQEIEKALMVLAPNTDAGGGSSARYIMGSGRISDWLTLL